MAVYNVKSLSFTKGDNTYNIDAGSSYYAVCATAGDMQVKNVTIDEITALEEGLSVRIIFSNEQLFNGVPKLQINSLAAANIQSVAGVDGKQYMWKAGEVIDLVYNGTSWVIVGRGATPSTRIIQVNTTVADASGNYTTTIQDARITSDMKAISLEIQNPYAFNAPITVTCNAGSVVFSCPDVSGSSNVTINIVKAALDAIEVTSSEFDTLDAEKVDKTDFNTAIADKQNITDNSLTTTDKTIVGAINENLSSIFDLQEGLAIIANGDTHASISSGQFVYVRNHATLPDGLYKAVSTIGTNAALTTLNLADISGALNDVKAQLNSTIADLTTATQLTNNVDYTFSYNSEIGQIFSLKVWRYCGMYYVAIIGYTNVECPANSYITIVDSSTIEGHTNFIGFGTAELQTGNNAASFRYITSTQHMAVMNSLGPTVATNTVCRLYALLIPTN